MTPILLKRKCFMICLLTLPMLLNAQVGTKKQPKPTRNIIWFTPSAASTIKGLAVGIQALNFDDSTLTIKGINADVGLFAAFTVIPAVTSGFALSKEQREQLFPQENDSAGTIIYGLSISAGGELGVESRGIYVAGSVTIATKLYGLSITGVYSRCYEFRGVAIAGLNNIARKGRGLQIGLFNNCKDLKGFQIGLWNKSGKRGLPFFNWGT